MSSVEVESIEDGNNDRENYYKELDHAILKAEKFQDVVYNQRTGDPEKPSGGIPV